MIVNNSITTQQETTNLQELADSELTQATLSTTNIRVFPNPFNSELLIETSVIDEVEIHSVDGVRVAISKVDAGVNRLSTNSFAQGVYFLYFKNQNISVKIVKQ